MPGRRSPVLGQSGDEAPAGILSQGKWNRSWNSQVYGGFSIQTPPLQSDVNPCFHELQRDSLGVQSQRGLAEPGLYMGLCCRGGIDTGWEQRSALQSLTPSYHSLVLAPFPTMIGCLPPAPPSPSFLPMFAFEGLSVHWGWLNAGGPREFVCGVTERLKVLWCVGGKVCGERSV